MIEIGDLVNIGSYIGIVYFVKDDSITLCCHDSLIRIFPKEDVILLSKAAQVVDMMEGAILSVT